MPEGDGKAREQEAPEEARNGEDPGMGAPGLPEFADVLPHVAIAGIERA
jgi:hypothetical protein